MPDVGVWYQFSANSLIKRGLKDLHSYWHYLLTAPFCKTVCPIWAKDNFLPLQWSNAEYSQSKPHTQRLHNSTLLCGQWSPQCASHMTLGGGEETAALVMKNFAHGDTRDTDGASSTQGESDSFPHSNISLAQTMPLPTCGNQHVKFKQQQVILYHQ